jgi:predicted nuclease of predicted toxin-antitoxin system
MKFLLDQDVYAVTSRFLTTLGHDVVMVSQVGISQADDSSLLHEALAQGRIFVTRDRDFGGIVFIQGIRSGLIYLRMLPATQNAVHAELERVLSLYEEQKLRDSFVVVEPSRHRIRKLAP